MKIEYMFSLDFCHSFYISAHKFNLKEFSVWEFPKLMGSTNHLLLPSLSLPSINSMFTPSQDLF